MNRAAPTSQIAPPPPTAKPQPEPESFEPPDAEVVTLEDLNRALLTYIRKNGEGKAKAVLAKFGVARASAVGPAELPALYKALT